MSIKNILLFYSKNPFFISLIIILILIPYSFALTENLQVSSCTATGCSVTGWNDHDNTADGSTLSSLQSDNLTMSKTSFDNNIFINQISIFYSHSADTGTDGNISIIFKNNQDTINYCNITISHDSIYVYSNITAKDCNWNYTRLNDLIISFKHTGTTNNLYNDYINFTIDYDINYAPKINTIELNDQLAGDNSILLKPNSTKKIYCTGNATDQNDNNHITINGTIYSTNSSINDPDNNLNHYSNSSCYYNPTTSDYNCSFDVYFYADPDTWTCNISANDKYHNLKDTKTDQATIQELFAIDIPDNTFINFGNMIKKGYNTDRSNNITIQNQGNVMIDIALDAWEIDGNQDSQYSMNCSKSTYIPIENMRGSLTHSIIFNNYINFTQIGYKIFDANLNRATSGTNPTKKTIFLALNTPDIDGECEGIISVLASPNS